MQRTNNKLKQLLILGPFLGLPCLSLGLYYWQQDFSPQMSKNASLHQSRSLASLESEASDLENIQKQAKAILPEIKKSLSELVSAYQKSSNEEEKKAIEEKGQKLRSEEYLNLKKKVEDHHFNISDKIFKTKTLIESLEHKLSAGQKEGKDGNLYEGSGKELSQADKEKIQKQVEQLKANLDKFVDDLGPIQLTLNDFEATEISFHDLGIVEDDLGEDIDSTLDEDLKFLDGSKDEAKVEEKKEASQVDLKVAKEEKQVEKKEEKIAISIEDNEFKIESSIPQEKPVVKEKEQEKVHQALDTKEQKLDEKKEAKKEEQKEEQKVVKAQVDEKEKEEGQKATIALPQVADKKPASLPEVKVEEKKAEKSKKEEAQKAQASSKKEESKEESKVDEKEEAQAKSEVEKLQGEVCQGQLEIEDLKAQIKEHLKDKEEIAKIASKGKKKKGKEDNNEEEERPTGEADSLVMAMVMQQLQQMQQMSMMMQMMNSSQQSTPFYMSSPYDGYQQGMMFNSQMMAATSLANRLGQGVMGGHEQFYNNVSGPINNYYIGGQSTPQFPMLNALNSYQQDPWSMTGTYYNNSPLVFAEPSGGFVLGAPSFGGYDFTNSGGNQGLMPNFGRDPAANNQGQNGLILFQ